MNHPLGLSIGTANLVAAQAGGPPVIRAAVLRMPPGRAPEVGSPPDNHLPDGSGPVLTGFVDRVGDPVPLVADDGSVHHADHLLAEALAAMVCAVDGANRSPSVAIAVPAHWGAAELDALRAAVKARPSLSPGGVAPLLISDASAALTALRSNPGLPERGVVALLDFGAGGTGITLVDAGSDFAPIGRTVRYTEFSGDQIDQCLLIHVLTDIAGARDIDPAGTTAVVSLARLRERCRSAKERLSVDTATVLETELPGYRADARLTRAELENLIDGPLGGVITALEEALATNAVPRAALTAVATAGGGAATPLITERLSENMRVPVVTTPHPQLSAATGARLRAAWGSAADVPTSMVTASASWTGVATTVFASDTDTDGSAAAAVSTTPPALAWSEEEPGDDDYYYRAEVGPAGRRLELVGDRRPPAGSRPRRPRPRYSRAQLLLAVVAVLALVPIGALGYLLVSKVINAGSTQTTVSTSVAPEPAPPGPGQRPG